MRFTHGARQITAALYLDLPYIVDSIWRRTEFNVNRWFRYTVVRQGEAVAVDLTERPFVVLPQYWLFPVVLLFVAYGPTFDALCSVLGAAGMARARLALGVGLLAGSAVALLALTRYGIGRANQRFFKARVRRTARLRRVLVRSLLQVGLCMAVAPVALLGIYLCRYAALPVCHRVPSNLPAILQLLVTAGALAASWLAGRRSKPARGNALTCALLLPLLAAVLWAGVAAPSASEALQTPYPHVYAVCAIALAAIAALAPSWARFQFATIVRQQRAAYTAALQDTELFPGSRVDPKLSDRQIIAATVVGACYHLLELLLLPSLLLLFVPAHWVSVTLAVGFAAALSLLTMGCLTTRWQQMVAYVARLFLTGTPLVVSAGVIGLASLRVAQVQYVTTVLDAAPFGVIFAWIVMTYALFWWFEYAINTAATSELLRLLGSDAQAITGRVRYRPGEGVAVHMPADHRWIAPHGLGAFVALGWFADKDSGTPVAAFQSFGITELFARLTPPGRQDRSNDLVRRVQLYFLALNALAVLGLGLYLGYYGHGDRSNSVAPVVSALQPPQPAREVELAALLRTQARTHRPAIIVAASGGGTRAALYTAAALEGLARLGVSRDIVLLSGVSGGAVSVAYFYGHQRQLPMHAPQSVDWQQFKDRMTAPFIGDVLEGALEWRLVSRNALGTLLKESFDRQLFQDGQRLGDATRPALILNTTVAGHPQEDSDLLRGMFAAAHTQRESCDQQHIPYAIISGGRLIFTNLAQRSAFPASGSEVGDLPQGAPSIPDVRLPYVVVQDSSVLLSAAAALSANFPPVFTNARVDVPAAVPDSRCPTRAYYVTDGGAVENLGLLSALYALRQALDSLRNAPATDIPQIHLVLLEASAATYDYTPDRGINAASGGSKERLTGGLTVELLTAIAAIADAAGRPLADIQVHDLAMPLAFRSRGGFGTNWIFPESIAIANPRAPRAVPWYHALSHWHAQHEHATAILGRSELMQLWTELHDPDSDFCSMSASPPRDAAMQTVADWICGRMGAEQLPPDTQVTQWHALVQALRAAGASATQPARTPQ